MEDVNISLLAE